MPSRSRAERLLGCPLPRRQPRPPPPPPRFSDELRLSLRLRGAGVAARLCSPLTFSPRPPSSVPQGGAGAQLAPAGQRPLAGRGSGPRGRLLQRRCSPRWQLSPYLWRLRCPASTTAVRLSTREGELAGLLRAPVARLAPGRLGPSCAARVASIHGCRTDVGALANSSPAWLLGSPNVSNTEAFKR